MKNNCGIYKITCLPTGKIYIGSAVNLLKRKQNHFEALANGVHKNIHLQNAYKKYGKSSFVFEVLEMVENKNNLLAREQFWINETKCTNRKVGGCAICGETKSGHKNTDEMVVDHCHKTKKVRGLLCNRCNTLLGLIDDSPTFMKNITNYLNK